MTARALLHHDPRFALAPWRARACYLIALEHQDAAGDLVAVRGRTVAEALAVAAHCPVAEAEGAIAEMVAAGLAEAHPDRLALLVGSRRGRNGGQSDAERKRAERARKRAPAPGPDGGGHADASRDSHGASAVTVTANVTGNVTGEAGDKVGEPAKGHESVTPGAVTSPADGPPPAASLSPPLSLPLASPSLSPTPFPPPPTPLAPAGAVAAGSGGAQLGLLAEQPAAEPAAALVAAAKPKRERTPKARAADEPAKLPFTVADVMLALAEGSGGLVIATPFDQRLAKPITAVIRGIAGPDVTLADIRMVGECFAAGALGREQVCANWVATTGRLATAIGTARAWRKGRPTAPVVALAPRPAKATPAPVSASFVDDDEDPYLRDVRRRAEQNARDDAARKKASGDE